MPSSHEITHKAHRPSQSGKKAGKNNALNEKVPIAVFYPVSSPLMFTLQAFAPRSGRRAERQGRRAADKYQTSLHVPLVDRTPNDSPPPIIVAIVGPPGVGKSTLVKSLVRRYTKQTLNDIRGPVTVVSGKKRRLTLIECNNDLGSMIDIGKVADLVLLMIDGSFGFEMVSPLATLLCEGVLHFHRKRLSFSTSYKLMASQKLLVFLPI
jgi:ribosome biogenesis protein BMS1